MTFVPPARHFPKHDSRFCGAISAVRFRQRPDFVDCWDCKRKHAAQKRKPRQFKINTDPVTKIGYVTGKNFLARTRLLEHIREFHNPACRKVDLTRGTQYEKTETGPFYSAKELRAFQKEMEGN